MSASAQGHLVARPKGETLKAREASQMTNLYHARYVCRHGARQHKRWSCKAMRWLTRELAETRKALEPQLGPRAAIRAVFGRYADQALHVAYCESHYSIWAKNGQYLGLFQMGDRERETYGHGNTAIAQARAAHRYFEASGSDWSPWDPKCRP